MYRAHVEATFEAAHMADVPDHKCTGTRPGITDRLAERIIEHATRLNINNIDLLLDALETDIVMDFHGHSWLAEIEFDYEEVDEHFWGVDFGKAKDIIRSLDHHNLNLVFEQPTSEFLSKWLYEEFGRRFGFFPAFVKLHEGRGNVMIYSDPSND